MPVNPPPTHAYTRYIDRTHPYNTQTRARSAQPQQQIIPHTHTHHHHYRHRAYSLDVAQNLALLCVGRPVCAQLCLGVLHRLLCGLQARRLGIQIISAFRQLLSLPA